MEGATSESWGTTYRHVPPPLRQRRTAVLSQPQIITGLIGGGEMIDNNRHVCACEQLVMHSCQWRAR